MILRLTSEQENSSFTLTLLIHNFKAKISQAKVLRDCLIKLPEITLLSLPESNLNARDLKIPKIASQMRSSAVDSVLNPDKIDNSILGEDMSDLNRSVVEHGNNAAAVFEA